MNPLRNLVRNHTTRDRLQARILSNTVFVPETGCRLWIRRHNNQGYPTMTMRLPGYTHVVTMLAHRVACAVFNRAPRPGEEAAHDPEKCPHKNCCEATHLRWATRLENEADKRHPSRLRLREVHPPLGREEVLTT